MSGQLKVRSENRLRGFFQSTGYVEVFLEKSGAARWRYLLGALKIEMKSIPHYFLIVWARAAVLLNPSRPRTVADRTLVTGFVEYAKSLGVNDVGFAKLDPGLLFRGERVISTNAIVLTLEMDKSRIDQAPSKQTFLMIHDTYYRLNVITLRLSRYLRKHGYAAQPSPATLGYAHYPPLAEAAGLGQRGWHGLLISPGIGPRQRVSMILTSIENLPFSEVSPSPHAWIGEFCQTCKRCATKCPVGAIPKQLETDSEGHQIHVHAKKCVDYFSQNYGCTICVKECTFNRSSYEQLRRSHLKRSSRHERDASGGVPL
jgi:ferredoxin